MDGYSTWIRLKIMITNPNIKTACTRAGARFEHPGTSRLRWWYYLVTLHIRPADIDDLTLGDGYEETQYDQC
jgi:hypothetical protein